MVKTPPVDGTKETSPRDVENVDRSSCANWIVLAYVEWKSKYQYNIMHLECRVDKPGYESEHGRQQEHARKEWQIPKHDKWWCPIRPSHRRFEGESHR